MNIADKCFLPVALGALLLIGCSGGDSTASSKESTTEAASSNGTIAISVLTTENPYFNVIIASLTEEAEKHGYEVLATSGDYDVAKQQNQVKDFIVKQVTAMVLCPCESKSIGPAIQVRESFGF